MFPGVDGFHWSFGHVLFLSLFFAVALTIAGTVARAVWRTAQDFRTRKASALCWDLEFAELPAGERRCRHEVAGRIGQRTCPNAFDCRRCQDYDKFAYLPANAPDLTFGLEYPEDRRYHRGHTWVHAEGDGTWTVGLDDLASRLVGTPDRVELPEPGSMIDVQGTAWVLTKGGHRIRVRAPLDGRVVETGNPERGWYLRIQPESAPNLRHLLTGPEVRGWLTRELERLQIQLAAPGMSPSLADGGILINGLMDAVPDADWDNALAATFLDS